MRTEIFKTRDEFEMWERERGHCIFTIVEYSDDFSMCDFVCDMIEDDFYYLSDEKIGLINPEGDYYLLKKLTDGQKRLMAENYGIKIIIIDEELVLA